MLGLAFSQSLAQFAGFKIIPKVISKGRNFVRADPRIYLMKPTQGSKLETSHSIFRLILIFMRCIDGRRYQKCSFYFLKIYSLIHEFGEMINAQLFKK